MATEREHELFEKAKDVINDAFPDLACLRCGYTIFGLTIRGGIGDLYTNTSPARYDLTCERCGKVETYDSRFLEKALKPIRRIASDG